MGKITNAVFCNNCPRNHYGVCSGILKILAKDKTFGAPKPFSLPAKQFLYHQGKSPVKTYILREGWVLLIKTSEKGERQIIRSVLPGDILGFQTDIDKPFAYSAFAIQNSIVCSTPDLFNMCNLYPELTLKLMWEDKREKILAEQYMSNIAHRDAYEKIAFMALELYQRLKLRGLNNGYIIPFPLNQEDIADTLGLTTIHVNRTLHKLEEENVLALHKHELIILDYPKLNDLVGQELNPTDSCDDYKVSSH